MLCYHQQCQCEKMKRRKKKEKFSVDFCVFIGEEAEICRRLLFYQIKNIASLIHI